MTLYIILCFVALCAGMALSVYAFGTGGKRKRIFQDIYFSAEETDGVGVLYTKTGEYSAVLKIENPVQKYSADIDSYEPLGKRFRAYGYPYQQAGIQPTGTVRRFVSGQLLHAQ